MSDFFRRLIHPGRFLFSRGLPLYLLLAFIASTSSAPAGETEQRPMSYGQAIALGLTEGLTEFLPVSSTGHLLVLQRILGLQKNGAKDAADSYAIAIQLGAILAVLGLYHRRWRDIAEGLISDRNPEGRNMGFCLIAAFLPIAILGFISREWIKRNLFDVEPISLAWVAGGIGLLAWSGFRRSPGWRERGSALESITLRQAWWIGLAQCLALWPGISRSLATVIGGLLAGLCMSATVEFSFLLGLITLGTATLFELVHSGTQMLNTYGWVCPLIGMAVSFLFAVFSMRWMVQYLQKHSLLIFGWYRILIGGLTFVAWRAGWI